MVDLPWRGLQDSLAKQEIEKAHELANTLTLNSLTSKLKHNPATDLTQTLAQQANVYPQLRGSLEQAAPRKATKQGGRALVGKSAKETTQTNGPDAHSEIGDFLIDGPIQITHPLAQRIVELAGMTAFPPEATSQHRVELAIGINKAIKKGKILWKLHGTVVVGIGASEVVKIGTSIDLDEVTNLSYINAHAPAVPAPKCLGCLTAKGRTYFFMSRSDGVTLETVWADLSIENKLSIKAQLNAIFHSLRNAQRLPSPTQAKFGSFASAVCKDMRREQRISAAPIRSEAQFNDFLCYQTGRTATAWVKMIRAAMRDDHQLVMTHADLHPRNIMVKWEEDEQEGLGHRRERGIRITALLDWESSGWYPEYWEFVKALSTISMRGKMADWLEYLPTETIGNWPVELSINLLLDRWLG